MSLSNTNRIPRLGTCEYIRNTQFTFDLDFVFEDASLYSESTNFTVKIEWLRLRLKELYTKDTIIPLRVFDLSEESGVKVYLEIPDYITQDWPDHRTDGVISIYKGLDTLDPLAIGKIEPVSLYK